MLSVCPVSKRPIVLGYAADQLRYCCVPIFIATGVCRVLCMHWVSRVTVTIVSVAAVQWVFLAFAQGVLSGVSPRLDTSLLSQKVQVCGFIRPLDFGR